jgi:glutamyl/glutaminyl-tRNA synthetase
MEKIITRFPPSPTAIPRGSSANRSVQLALRRHMKGKFILRIEDTDIERSTLRICRRHLGRLGMDRHRLGRRTLFSVATF